MRRTVLLVGAWLVGGAAAIAAASLGVSRVGDQVTDDRPTPLSAAEVREELAAAATTTTLSAGSPTTTTEGSSASPTTSTLPTGRPPLSVTTPPPPTAAAETRTYALVGGTATLRFSPTGVTVVAATPNRGFSVETSPEHGNGIRVEFDSDGHRSRVTGWWEDGPRDEVREED